MNYKNYRSWLMVPAALLVAGCAAPYVAPAKREAAPGVSERDRFLERFSNASVKKGANLAIVRVGDSTNESLAMFIMAELRDQGFNVVLLNPIRSVMAVPGASERNVPGGTYLNITSSHAFGETESASKQLADYIKSFGSVLEKQGVDYVLGLRQGGLYNYYAEIINPKTSTVEGVYYLSAERQSWNKRMGALKASGYGQTITDEVRVESARYPEMQYSKYLVGILLGRVPPWQAKNQKEEAGEQ